MGPKMRDTEAGLGDWDWGKEGEKGRRNRRTGVEGQGQRLHGGVAGMGKKAEGSRDGSTKKRDREAGLGDWGWGKRNRV